MAAEHTFKTQLIWHDSTGAECDCEATVTYVAHKGCPATLEDPGEEAAVEIIRIVDAYGEHVPDHFLTSGDLMVECFDDWAADVAAAAEYRAEARRDDLMMGDHA